MFVWLVAFTDRYWNCIRSTGFQRNWFRILFGVGLLYLAKLAQLAYDFNEKEEQMRNRNSKSQFKDNHLDTYHKEQRHVAVRFGPLSVLQFQLGRIESMVHERGARGEQVLGVVWHAVPFGQIQALQGVVQHVHVALHIYIKQVLQSLIHSGHVPGIGIQLDQALSPECVVRTIRPWRIEKLNQDLLGWQSNLNRKLLLKFRSLTSIASKIARSL